MYSNIKEVTIVASMTYFIVTSHEQFVFDVSVKMDIRAIQQAKLIFLPGIRNLNAILNTRRSLSSGFQTQSGFRRQGTT